MRSRWSWILLLAATAAGADEGAEEGEPQSTVRLEEVTIIGTREEADGIAGAAHRLDEEALARFSHADVQRIVRQVPGVSVQLEDGYGLRPNISIRGVATERSARITLLEDGVLIAPAPYSAPSAYYFPTAGRMASFEVLKGPSAITQGPYTIGGAFNMISTPVPASAGVGDVFIEAGQHGTGRLHATYGGTGSNGFGYLLETHRWVSDGFQSVDRSSSDTGLDVRDYTVKFALSPPASPHRVELKLQFADQVSNQSYLGLTDADFHAAPTRRYGLSALDRIETDHEQTILRYEYDARRQREVCGLRLRQPPRAQLVQDGGDRLRRQRQCRGVLPHELVQRGPGRQSRSGSWRSSPRWNSARYCAVNWTLPPAASRFAPTTAATQSRGVQLGANWTLTTGASSHTLRVGVRYHEDEEDRLQRNSAYSQRDGRLHLDDHRSPRQRRQPHSAGGGRGGVPSRPDRVRRLGR